MIQREAISPPITAEESRRIGWRWENATQAVMLGSASLLLFFAFRFLLEIGVEQQDPQVPAVEEFFFSPSGGSPAIVFFGSAWMLASRWRRLLSTLGETGAPLLGSLVLAASVALFVWAYHVSGPVVLIPSLSLLLLALALLGGGLAGGRAVLLPAFFLLLAVPMPSVLVNELIYPLQLATARWTTALLNAVGLPTATHAEFILRERGLFQVIETCSGLRMIETLLMTAVLYSELFRTSWPRTAILLASVPLVSVLCNQVRVISIVLNPYSQFAAVHTAQGLVMIVVGVLLLAVVDGLAVRLLGNRAGAPRLWRVRKRQQGPSFAMLGGLIAVAIGLAAASELIPRWQEPQRPLGLSSSLPASIGEWAARGLKTDRQFLGSTRYDEGFSRRYWRGEEHVDVFVARDLRLDPSRSLISPKTELPGSRSAVLERMPTELMGREATTLVVSDGRERELVHHVRVGAGSIASELLRVTFALDRGPWRRPGQTLVLRASTPIDEKAGRREAAERRLADFLRAAEADLTGIFEVAEARPLG